MNDNSVIVENKKIDENSSDKSKTKNQKDECIELKNIKYKSMLLNGVQKEPKAISFK